MAMTYEERVAQIDAMLHDPDLALTPREAFELILRWGRFEYALMRQKRQDKRVEKYAKWMSDITEIYNLRKALADQ